MIDQKRIEAGARALDPKAWAGGDGSEFARRRQASMWEAGLVINAAFPEFDGQHPSYWLAPMEATKEMLVAAEDRFEDFKDSDWSSDADGNRYDYTIIRSGFAHGMWVAARDAHLKEKQT